MLWWLLAALLWALIISATCAVIWRHELLEWLGYHSPRDERTWGDM